MLVSPHKSQQLPRRLPNLSSTTSSTPSYASANRNFFNLSLSSATPSPSEPSGKLQNYFDSNTSSAPASSVVLDTSNIPINNIDVFMPHSLDFQSNQSNNYPFSLADTTDDLSMWQLGGGNGVANQMEAIRRSSHNHQRIPSSSSIGSTASAVTASPFHGQQARGLRGQDQASSKQSAGRGYSSNQSARNHLPTPTQTPTRNSFLSPTSPSFSQQGQDMNSTIAASLGLNQALEDDLPQMSHSNRQSFSSMRGPPTPMTAVGDGHDDRQRSIHNDSMNNAMVTVSSSLPDLFYSPNMATSQAPSNPNFLMPHGNAMMNERLMEAQMARSQSSGSNQSVPLSPMKYHASPHTDSEPKTISPKDALLDYNPSANDVPLFGQTTAGMSASYPAVATTPTQRQQFNQPNVMDFSNINGSQSWAPSLPTLTSAAMPTYSNFATPSLPSNLNMGNMSSGYLGASGSHPRRTVSRHTDQAPEFPAQLTSMESSVSEAAPPSSGASANMLLTSPKPESAADTGTYSCTYHGCLQRFSTPQKLQKHKRDVHRNTPHVTPGVGSGMSTAQLMERNSQSGPHKCERPNPITGKMCNAVFSRPYDLTRHEDTIHNARKQKVRCAICTEDKTFSRSDALTRHMRVVHPEVDFPGKHRKRGSRGE